MQPATQQLLDLIKVRRSTYTLSQETTLPVEDIKTILETTLEQAPSTFGSYTTRIVLVVKEEHQKLWSIIREIIKGVTPPDKYEGHTKGRLDGFANAYGTVLFFEDPENTNKLVEKFPFGKDHFPVWAQHTSAIHQVLIWTALTNSGLGANLQHYNPLIDDRVQGEYGVPKEWKLVAQMVFGKPTAPPGPKAVEMKKPLSERLFIHGA